MHNRYMEEYQINTISQISGKILRVYKQLKPAVLPTVIPSLSVNARYEASLLYPN